MPKNKIKIFNHFFLDNTSPLITLSSAQFFGWGTVKISNDIIYVNILLLQMCKQNGHVHMIF